MNWAGRYATGYAQPPSYTEDLQRRQQHEQHVLGYIHDERVRKVQDEHDRLARRQQRRDDGFGVSGYGTGQDLEDHHWHRRAAWWPHVRETWDVPAHYTGQNGDPDDSGEDGPQQQQQGSDDQDGGQGGGQGGSQYGAPADGQGGQPPAPPTQGRPRPPPPGPETALHKRVHAANHGDAQAIHWFQQHGRHPCGHTGAPCVRDRIGLWVYPPGAPQAPEAPAAPDFEALAPEYGAQLQAEVQPEYQQYGYVESPTEVFWAWDQWGQVVAPPRGWHPGAPLPAGWRPGAPAPQGWHPGLPVAPGVPWHPGAGVPFHPGAPGLPFHPGVPFHPGAPVHPGAPTHFGAPPQHPIYGGAPGAPSHPVYTPGHPGSFTPPTTPGTPSHPVYTPGHPGSFTPPTTPGTFTPPPRGQPIPSHTAPTPGGFTALPRGTPIQKGSPGGGTTFTAPPRGTPIPKGAPSGGGKTPPKMTASHGPPPKIPTNPSNPYPNIQ